MFKQLIGFSLVVLGVFSMVNFISHHVEVPLTDSEGHVFAGLIMIVLGFVVALVPFKLGSWSNFKG